MVFHKERDNERPPLSCILPHLYLGAETDVTQDSLSARGISYVLSVSRCSPQPTFLPKSQYLRIPIDDSLRDDLLPWIPQALRFIDGAMSLGCSVLVHCAAGISRSPALAVAYIMYRLGMDLDHAYRFVKERRPSISPNFNFLGQLQLFQGTLSPAGSSPHHTTTRPSDGALDSLPSSIKNTSNRTECSPTHALLSTKLSSSAQDVKNSSSSSRVHAEDKNVNNTLRHEASHTTLTQGHQDCTKQQDSTTATAQSVKRAATQSKSPEFTLSLSDKLKSLTLNLQPIEVQRPASPSEPSTAQQRNSSNNSNNPQKPTSLHIPSDAAGSISEKRKRLTLALTPVSGSPQTMPQQQQQPEERSNKSKKRGDVCQDPAYSLQVGHKGETGTAQHKSRKSLRKAEDEKERLRRASRSRRSNSHRSSSRSVSRRKDQQSQERGVQREAEATRSATKYHQSPTELRGAKPVRSKKDLPTPSSSTLMRGSLHKIPPSTAVEAVEGSSGEADLMSPLSLTVNKLLDWGERMLLGVLLGPRIKVAQPALPYRC